MRIRKPQFRWHDPSLTITVVSCYPGKSGLWNLQYNMAIRTVRGTTLPDAAIQFQVECLTEMALDHPNWIFQVTRLVPEADEPRVAPLFHGVPDNVLLPGEW